MAELAELKPQLDSASTQERWLAAWHLSQAGKEAAPALIAALKHADSVVRYWAAVGLRAAGDKAAVEPLRLALKDESGDVRVAAAEALVQLAAAQEGTQGLAAACEHPSEWVRLRALQAIERLGPAAADALPAARKAAGGGDYPGRMAEHFGADKAKERKKEKPGSP